LATRERKTPVRIKYLQASCGENTTGYSGPSRRQSKEQEPAGEGPPAAVGRIAGFRHAFQSRGPLRRRNIRPPLDNLARAVAIRDRGNRPDRARA
jgi:hypothetical protein